MDGDAAELGRACYKDQYRGLPAEIRLKIWRYMIPSITTVLNLDYPRQDQHELSSDEELERYLGMRKRLDRFTVKHVAFSSSLNLQILQLNQTIRKEAQPLFAQHKLIYDLTKLDDEHVEIFLNCIIRISSGLRMMDGIRLARHWSEDELKLPYDPSRREPCDAPIPIWPGAPESFLNKLTIVFDTSRWLEDTQDNVWLKPGPLFSDLLGRSSDGPEQQYERLIVVIKRMWSFNIANQYTRLLFSGVVKELVLEFEGCDRVQRDVVEKLIVCTAWTSPRFGLKLQVRSEVEVVGDKFDVCIVAAGPIESSSAKG